MYYPTTGTSAYKPEQAAPKTKTKVSTGKTAKKQSKGVTVKPIAVLVIAAVFVLSFTIMSRYVRIYGQHDEIAQKTKQLENLKMANDQLSVEINSLKDRSRIEQYATEKLNLKKMDSNQIVYIKQSTDDNMQKIAHNRKSIFSGIFGLFSGVAEYLK